MTDNPLHFELPANLNAKKFLAQLGKKAVFQLADQQYSIKSYYDSFDWRLFNADLICELNQSQLASELTLIDKSSDQIIAQEAIQDVPSFSEQFPNGRIRETITPALEMRALLPLCKLPYEAYYLNILNKDQKTVLRIQLDAYESIPHRVSLLPLKGYDKALKKIQDIFQNTLELKPVTSTVLKAALKIHNRKPKDYSSKLSIKLKPDMSADKASKIIYRHLLKAMQVNEAGTIADIDSEFLHDFRVAIRRTRAGLSQIKNTLPLAVVKKYAEFFSWLGQITSQTRDMDVYLLGYKQYQMALPISLREDIAPLYGFLKHKQSIAQKQLADKLNSSTYRKQLSEWEAYLNEPVPEKTKGSHAGMTIKQLADQRIWKVYRRLLKDGEAITDSSPAEALHDLRKTCKKLRYLLEFFQNLYPPEDMKRILKTLKGFQNVLGDFQDYEVQETNIKRFSEEMMDNNISSNTLLAMGVLVQYLDTMRCSARNDFAAQFGLFEQADNQAVFKRLFAHKASGE